MAQHNKQKKKIKFGGLPDKINPLPDNYNEKPNNKFLFTFSDFKLNAINIKNIFNNHYKSADEYMKIITVLLAQGLPSCSNETTAILADFKKGAKLHFHPIKEKDEVLRKILKEYEFRDDYIDNLLEGENLYQFEIPFLNGAPRVVFQKIENIISVLFIDTNHHIYVNEKKQKENHSFGYKYCPIKKFIKK